MIGGLHGIAGREHAHNGRGYTGRCTEHKDNHKLCTLSGTYGIQDNITKKDTTVFMACATEITFIVIH